MNPVVKKTSIALVYALAGAVYFLGSVGAAWAYEHHEHHHVAEETGHVRATSENPDQLPVGLYADHFSLLTKFPSSHIVFPLESIVRQSMLRVRSTRAPPKHV